MVNLIHKATLRRNAFFNILGGGIQLLISLTIPMLIIRTYTPHEALLWNLAFQVVIFTQVTSAGIPGVISRYIPRNHRNDPRIFDGTIQASKYIVKIATAISAIISTGCVAYYFLENGSLNSEIGKLYASLGISAIFATLLLLPGGFFLGSQKNHLWVTIQACSKLLGLLAASISMILGLSLSTTGSMYAAGICVAIPFSFWLMRQDQRFASVFEQKKHERLVKTIRTGMLKWYATFLTLNFSQILVVLSAVYLVNWLDKPNSLIFSQTQYLYNAMTAVLIAVVQPYMPLFVQLKLKPDGKQLALELLVKLQTKVMALYAVVFALAILFGEMAMDIWTDGYGEGTMNTFMLMLSVNAIRGISIPISGYFLSVKSVREAIVPSAIESIVFLVFLILLPLQNGMEAVIGSMLAASFAGIATYNIILLKGKSEMVKPKKLSISAQLIFCTICISNFLIWTQ